MVCVFPPSIAVQIIISSDFEQRARRVSVQSRARDLCGAIVKIRFARIRGKRVPARHTFLRETDAAYILIMASADACLYFRGLVTRQ